VYVRAGQGRADKEATMVRVLTFDYRTNLLWIAYLIVGIVVAADRHYFEAVNNIEQVAEAGLAIFLWPLVLLDVSMRI
jgi:hypothetical protein